MYIETKRKCAIVLIAEKKREDIRVVTVIPDHESFFAAIREAVADGREEDSAEIIPKGKLILKEKGEI